MYINAVQPLFLDVYRRTLWSSALKRAEEFHKRRNVSRSESFRVKLRSSEETSARCRDCRRPITSFETSTKAKSEEKRRREKSEGESATPSPTGLSSYCLEPDSALLLLSLFISVFSSLWVLFLLFFAGPFLGESQ